MILKKLLVSTLLFTSVLSAENSIGLDINSDDVELLADYSLNSVVGYIGGTNYQVGMSYLHNENDDLFTLAVSGENSLEAAPGIILGFGFKATFAEDFMALPLLARVKYILPFDSDIPKSSLLASVAYAPSVLTFSDGEKYYEFRLEAEMEVISNIYVFTGYRNIDTDYETRDYNLNDNFYGGLKLSF